MEKRENEDINRKCRHLIKQITGQAPTGRGKREFVAKCEGWGQEDHGEMRTRISTVNVVIKQSTGQAGMERGCSHRGRRQ
jgi:hypothetical protein